MIKRLFSLLFLISIFNGTNAIAETQYWVVNKVAGQAILTKHNQEPQWVMLNDRLGAGDKITTLKNGTVALIRNAEAMIISSNSEIEIPTNGNDSQFTLVFQKLGTVLFSAKKKNRKHFQIRTPYAAAIVKGTTFAINANRYNTQIQVFEGMVSVSGRGRGETFNLGAGKKSLIPSANTQKIIINTVANASGIHLHYGNDVDQISLNYLNKIEIGAGENEFNHDVIVKLSTGGIVETASDAQPQYTNSNGNSDKTKPNNTNVNTGTENSISTTLPVVEDGKSNLMIGDENANVDKGNNSANGESSSANSGNGGDSDGGNNGNHGDGNNGNGNGNSGKGNNSANGESSSANSGNGNGNGKNKNK